VFAVAVLAATGLLLLGTPAAAQEAGQVFVYQHSNFGGAYMRFDSNREVSDLRGLNTGALGTANWNDQISSIKVGKDRKIVCYADINYAGASITLYGSSCDTTGSYSSMPSGWNDRVSSFKILDNDKPQPGPEPSSEQACVYEHVNYCGAYIRVVISEIPDLRSYNTGASGTPNWNDRISSIRVGGNVKILVYGDINYGNYLGTLTGPSTVATLVPSGWNDKISSLKVVPK
jgi:hypothetical protein